MSGWPRWLKVLVWLVVFAVCAGAGAFVASRTDPFPPGVEDPGARPSATRSSPTRPARPPVWKGRFKAQTRHDLHVGGACRSDWVATFRMELADDGTVDGDGRGVLVPATAGCDFEQAQVQTDRVAFSVRGTWETVPAGTVLRLTLGDLRLDPSGSLDLGGLAQTVATIRPVLEPQRDAVPPKSAGAIDATRPDGNEGTYVAAYGFFASCAGSC